MKKWIMLSLFSVSWMVFNGQETGLVSGRFINGYAEKISGSDFSYHSSIPDAKECLLVRATDGKSSMTWKTAPVEVKTGDQFITVAWLSGIGSSPGIARFNLAVNGIPLLSFWADGKDQWELTAKDGSRLSFQKEMVDQFGDRFGFMFLILPVSSVKAGEPLAITVTGGNFGKTSWYMTFRYPLKNGLTLKAMPALLMAEGKPCQLGIAGILHFGKPALARIFVGNKQVAETPVNFGYNYVRINLPEVTKNKTVPYRMEIAGRSEAGKIVLSPVRHWRVNFVQLSHTDIGYTRPQTEILAEHLRYIDYALDYCDLTDSYPDGSQFRWTCEAAWAVDEYLKCRPASQIERLKKRVAESRIEITSMYFNFDELPDEQILAASLQPVKRFREEGLEVKTAMQNDVNGIGWCLNDYFHDLGIRYLNMGTHGHRALICFDKPTLFWWESPSGNRMLAYRAEHYMTGNTVFKIHAGDFNRFEEQLLTYLTALEAKGYDYDLISIQHSGFLTDNSPPSTLACDMIRQWNKKYAWPKLKTATATEFFEEMEAKYGARFPVIRGAWPDWWTDGFGASAREVAATRTAEADLIAHSAGLTMAGLMGATLPEKIADRLEDTYSALLFYTEHTVGYHGSVSEPFSRNTMEQRALKESYAWEAGRRAKMIGEEAHGLLQSFFPRENKPLLVVYNTLAQPRSGLLMVYIDHQEIPKYAKFRLVGPDGIEAKAQPVESFSDGTYWAVWVNDIPGFGYRKYHILISDKETEAAGFDVEKNTNTLENQWYRLEVDTSRAAINTLYDKSLEKELTDRKAEWKLGEFIYETLGNRSQMESRKLDNFHRVPLDKVGYEGLQKGTLWNSFRFRGNTGAAMKEGDFLLEIRVFNTTKRIDLVYSIEKKMVTDPEGIYIAFPFEMEKGQLAFDVPGGEIRAGIDQIPGSSNDWNTVQTYARVHNSEGQILLCSNEAPLMQFGGINTGRYRAGATPASTHIFGWPMNNYWTTNFNAEQHGGHTWTYSLTSSGSNSRQESASAGLSYRIPFLSRILPGGGTGHSPEKGSLITGWPENVLLISAVPEEGGKSAILHLRETGGKPAAIGLKNALSGQPMNCIPVDVAGEPLMNGACSMKPLESKFFRVIF